MNTKTSFLPKRTIAILLALVVACSGFLAAPATAFAASPETTVAKSETVAAVSEVLLATTAVATATEPLALEPLAAKKYKVTLTIKMGKQGCVCPFLTLTKGSKSYYSQVVSKWYIDGRLERDPFTRFYSPGWDFSKHNIKIVMTIKVPKGTYKVFLNNGKKTKQLGTVKVKNKAVKKTKKFA
ncbi:MAG: hypothetical protein FWG00_06100 [Coriobacteriia bacterium]|nr:hypothetical protein [Coriobacteriia bacterium]